MKVLEQNIQTALIASGKPLLESDPLGGLRKVALVAFEKLGLPERKTELYKYTPVKRILEKNFDFSQIPESSTWTKQECHQSFYKDSNANHLVFTSGSFNPGFSVIKSPSSALSIEPINSKTIAESEDLRDQLGKVASTTDVFSLLNLYAFNQGLFIHSGKNNDHLQTYVYHFIDAQSQSIVMPRIFVKVLEGSHVKVVEKTFRKGENNVFTNSLIEAFCERNATLRWTKLQNYTSADYHMEGFYAHQFRDSKIYTNTLSFQGALIRNNLYISLEDENCETHMHGLYQIGNESHVDNNTTVDHRKPNSYSNELYKGIVDDHAHAVFNGKIYVRPQAQKTNAFQSNQNILLSEYATINTKPQLEIWADDVKCSHGCTTGQLDEEAIFYLRSRGISKAKAKSLVLNAFAGETLNEVRNEFIREEIESIILNKLGD